MHSSRMRTAHSSSHWGVGAWPVQLPHLVWAWNRSPSTSPLGVGLDQIPLNFPLGCGPGTDPPQLPPLVVGLDQIPLNFPIGCGPGDPSRTRHTPRTRHPPRPGTLLWTEFLTRASENITLPKLRLRAVIKTT